MLSCILPAFSGGAVGHGAVAARAGLQFASVDCAHRIVRPGLSATISLLTGLRLERKPGVSPDLAVERATVLVGPALILTTVVLACGWCDGVFRPAVAASVRLAQRVLDVAALVATSFILRPTAMFLINLSERLRGPTGRRSPRSRPGLTGRKVALAPRHRDIHARISPLELLCTVCLLPVVRKVRLGQIPSLDEHFDLPRPPCPADCQKCSGSFRSSCRKCASLAGHVAAQVEFVAVAGAMQILLQAEPGAVDLVVGLHRMRSVVPSDSATFRCQTMNPSKTSKRARLGVTGRHRSISAAPTPAAMIDCQTSWNQTFHYRVSHPN